MFEYPWAFQAGGISPGLKVLEIGGGLSGFQFVLSRCGCTVVNIDPGMEAVGRGWPCDLMTMAKLNRYFGTDVALRSTTVTGADLEQAHYDRVFSISVLEHLLPSEMNDVMRSAFAALKPGGLFIMTVDLFLNLVPFTTRKTNEFGRNVNIRDLVRAAPFDLVSGDRSELNGFPEFDHDRIQGHLEKYLLGTYPVLVQCVVLQKPVR